MELHLAAGAFLSPEQASNESCNRAEHRLPQGQPSAALSMFHEISTNSKPDIQFARSQKRACSEWLCGWEESGRCAAWNKTAKIQSKRIATDRHSDPV